MPNERTLKNQSSITPKCNFQFILNDKTQKFVNEILEAPKQASDPSSQKGDTVE